MSYFRFNIIRFLLCVVFVFFFLFFSFSFGVLLCSVLQLPLFIMMIQFCVYFSTVIKSTQLLRYMCWRNLSMCAMHWNQISSHFMAKKKIRKKHTQFIFLSIALFLFLFFLSSPIYLSHECNSQCIVFRAMGSDIENRIPNHNIYISIYIRSYVYDCLLAALSAFGFMFPLTQLICSCSTISYTSHRRRRWFFLFHIYKYLIPLNLSKHSIEHDLLLSYSYILIDIYLWRIRALNSISLE